MEPDELIVTIAALGGALVLLTVLSAAVLYGLGWTL
jgi:hypothetical protein